MKTLKFFAFAAAAVAMLSSCAKESVVSNEEDNGKTFTVTAEYTEPVVDTKTAFVDGENPYVKWQSSDQIIVYESIDGEYKCYHSQKGNIILSDDDKKATFSINLHTPSGGAPTGTEYCYTAFYPADCVKEGTGFYYIEIPSIQDLNDNNFATDSDILIGKPIRMNSRISETNNIEVQFKRPGTVVALTLKGIMANETISSVKITAPAEEKIVGRCKVNRTNGEVSDKAYYGGTNVITLNCSDVVATGNDKFYFRCLDGTWKSDEAVSINVETDKAYYSKTVNLPKDYVFADGGLTKFGFQGMTREAKSTGTPYTLVTSDSDLCDGASYIFVGIKNEAFYAMAEQNTNNRKSATVSAPVDNVITLPSTTGAYTFQLEKVTDGWAIKDITTGSSVSGQYLYAAAPGNNYMKSQENVDVNATWTITISENIASIVASGSSNRKNMRFNENGGNAPLFSCYGNASDQSPIYLYVDKSTCKEKVATPVLKEGSAAAGEVAVGTNIKLTCATEGATIHYTTDGTEPTATSAAYTDAGITINNDCTIKAIAVKEGCTDSDVLTLEYSVPVVANPEISFDGTTVNITCSTDGATIHYEIGGDDVSDPTSSSTAYDPSDKPSVTDGQTVKAIAIKSGSKDSQVVSLKYTTAPVVLTTVTVSGSPSKTTYTSGDSFEPAGLTVTGTFSDSHQETITEGITWSEPAALTAGQTSVTITATVSEITSEAYIVTGLTVTAAGPTDFSSTYTSNVTLSGSNKVIISNVEYPCATVGSSKNAGSTTFTVNSGTKYLTLHVVGWNNENGKTHTISTSVGTITPATLTTTSDTGAANNSPFTLSKNDYSSTEYYFVFELSGVTSNATITISNSGGKQRGVYFGVNAE